MMTPGSLHSVMLGTTRQVLSRVSKRMDLKLRAMYARAQLRRADMEKHHGSELQHRSASIMQERTRKWLAMLRAAAHNVNGMRV